MKLLICVFLSLQVVCLAQQDSSWRMNHGVRLCRMDFFLQNSLQKSNKRWQQEYGFAFGINRTIFQQRFFPELNARLNYELFGKSKFLFQATASLHSSVINVNKQQRDLHFYQEALLGFQMAYGARFKTGFTIESGLQNQRFKSVLTKHYEGFNTLGYSAQLSFSYAL